MARDVVALGWGAPLRAAYEASKRLGGHRAVFGRLARQDVGAHDRRATIDWPTEVPPAAIDRVERAAVAVANGTIRLFGRDCDLGSPPMWHSMVSTPGTWPAAPWWTIDIRGGKHAPDVKWVWELGRCHHVVVLARAAHFGRAHDAKPLADQVRSWLTHNPPERGIHWYANLQLALNAITFSEVLDRSGDALEPHLTAGLRAALWNSGQHLMADLPYTLSTMRNNHLLGDALGLQVIGMSFPDDRPARRWARVGASLFERQASRHFRPDGSMIEDSLSYHRFVLEMLIVRSFLPGGEAYRPAVRESAQLLARLGVLDGPVPQYGDWDEGRVLVSTQDPLDLSGSVRAALAVAGTGAPPAWREAHDECAWYVGEGDPVEPEPSEIDGHDIGGGIARGERGPLTVWLKAGSAWSHGHADLCSTPVLADGEWVIGDPGTGSYNGAPEERNYFRTSIAHSVLRLDGADQLEPHRAFRWRHSARGRIGEPMQIGEHLVLWAAHDAYRRHRPPRAVARVVVLSARGVVVADWVEGPPGERYALSLPLGPTADWDPADEAIGLRSGRRLALRAAGRPSAVTGHTEPFDGWWSRTYALIEPSTRLELRGVVSGPVWWLISLEKEPDLPAAASGGLSVDGLLIDVRFETGAVSLSVRAGGSTPRPTTRSLRW